LRNLESFAASYASTEGGVGKGRGEPLTATAVRAGGVGNGKGEPLKATVARAGGVGNGSGEPLRRVLETAAMRLLDNCLTELLTGSTIKTAKTRNAKRRKMFFFMAESLLAATMK